MTITEAFQIVLDLARENIIDFDHEDDELNEARKRLTEACNIIEDLAVNEYGDES